MEKAEAQLDAAKEAKTTNVHIYELEKAEAQSDNAMEAQTTNFQSPSEATEGGEVPEREAAERLAELKAAADAAAYQAAAVCEGASAGRRGGGAAARRARKAHAAYERALAAA